MKEKIFKLNRSKDAWGVIDFMKHQEGAVYIPTNGDSSFSVIMIGTRQEKLPNEICFASDFNVIPNIDFPYNGLNLDIFSSKMLSIFLELEEFDFRQVKVVMFDHKEMEAYHIEEGELLQDLKRQNNEYVAIQLMNYTDVFDYENSKYRKKRAFPDEVGSIRELVLKQPDNGFPLIFKIKEKKSQLFITEQAKNALEAADIKGCEFEEVEVSQ